MSHPGGPALPALPSITPIQCGFSLGNLPAVLIICNMWAGCLVWPVSGLDTPADAMSMAVWPEELVTPAPSSWPIVLCWERPQAGAAPLAPAPALIAPRFIVSPVSHCLVYAHCTPSAQVTLPLQTPGLQSPFPCNRPCQAPACYLGQRSPISQNCSSSVSMKHWFYHHNYHPNICLCSPNGKTNWVSYFCPRPLCAFGQ